jgi:hypothetical protein
MLTTQSFTILFIILHLHTLIVTKYILNCAINFSCFNCRYLQSNQLLVIKVYLKDVMFILSKCIILFISTLFQIHQLWRVSGNTCKDATGNRQLIMTNQATSFYSFNSWEGLQCVVHKKAFAKTTMYETVIGMLIYVHCYTNL